MFEKPFVNSLNLTAYTDLTDFVRNLLDLAISFSVLLVVISVVISGFKYMFSKGDDEKVKEATEA